MMEKFQLFLAIVGAITLLWLVYKAVKGIFVFMGGMLEAAFRDKFPDDFMMHFGWIISEMKTRGYKKVDVMDAGGENPGVLMRNMKTGNEMEIRLRAPLFTNNGYSIVVSNHGNNTAIVMQDTASEENKKLLSNYLDLVRVI